MSINEHFEGYDGDYTPVDVDWRPNVGTENLPNDEDELFEDLNDIDAYEVLPPELDPFYSEENMNRLQASIAQMEAARKARDLLEDEYDLKAYERAMTEFKKNPVTYSHEEVVRELELDNVELPNYPDECSVRGEGCDGCDYYQECYPI